MQPKNHISRCFRVLRAIHLQLVSDNTTQAFALLFDASYYDLGFHEIVIAKTEPDLLALIGNYTECLVLYYATLILKQASAPHFGGIWEARVKTMKFYLNRLLENTHSTYGEMTTFLSQIKANLNSRPIAPLGEYANALAPGHFIVGDPLTVLLAAFLLDATLNRLSRW